MKSTGTYLPVHCCVETDFGAKLVPVESYEKVPVHQAITSYRRHIIVGFSIESTVPGKIHSVDINNKDQRSGLRETRRCDAFLWERPELISCLSLYIYTKSFTSPNIIMKLAVSSLLVGSAAAFSLDMKAGEDSTCRKSVDQSTICIWKVVGINRWSRWYCNFWMSLTWDITSLDGKEINWCINLSSMPIRPDGTPFNLDWTV